jgi:hypothetical protein
VTTFRAARTRAHTNSYVRSLHAPLVLTESKKKIKSDSKKKSKQSRLLSSLSSLTSFEKQSTHKRDEKKVKTTVWAEADRDHAMQLLAELRTEYVSFSNALL